MKTIVCNVNPFSEKHSIMLIDDEQNVANIGYVNGAENLGVNIAYLCNFHKVKKVRLMGATKYNEAVAVDIMTAAKSNYGISNIEVEVI